MRKLTSRTGLLLLMTAIIASAIPYDTSAVTVMETQATESFAPEASAAENPLLAKWDGPYGGIPPFDKVRVADFKPALEAAMQENLSEIERIANDSAPPTFETPSLQWSARVELFNGCRPFTVYGALL